MIHSILLAQQVGNGTDLKAVVAAVADNPLAVADIHHIEPNIAVAAVDVGKRVVASCAPRHWSFVPYCLCLHVSWRSGMMNDVVADGQFRPLQSFDCVSKTELGVAVELRSSWCIEVRVLI